MSCAHSVNNDHIIPGKIEISGRRLIDIYIYIYIYWTNIRCIVFVSIPLYSPINLNTLPTCREGRGGLSLFF